MRTQHRTTRRAAVGLAGSVTVLVLGGALTVRAPAHGAPSVSGWPVRTTSAPRAAKHSLPPTTRLPVTSRPASEPSSGPQDATWAPADRDRPPRVRSQDGSDESGGCPEATGGAVTQAPGTGRTVALTFDDGPSEDTPALLEVLRRKHVPATFFVVGQEAAARPELVAQEAADGHLVEDHSWRHAFPQQVPGGWSEGFLRGDLHRTNEVITTNTGRPVCWFRPPGGYMPHSVLPVTHGARLRVALWSVDPQDWALQSGGRGLSAGRITEMVFSRVAVGVNQEHPLVLMHDGGGPRHAGIAAVARIIDLYRAHGYRFVRLDGSGNA